LRIAGGVAYFSMAEISGDARKDEIEKLLTAEAVPMGSGGSRLGQSYVANQSGLTDSICSTRWPQKNGKPYKDWSGTRQGARDHVIPALIDGRIPDKPGTISWVANEIDQFIRRNESKMSPELLEALKETQSQFRQRYAELTNGYPLVILPFDVAAQLEQLTATIDLLSAQLDTIKHIFAEEG